MLLKRPVNTITISLMLIVTFLILFFAGFLQFPPATTSNSSISRFRVEQAKPDPFVNLFTAFRKWDAQVGCNRFRELQKDSIYGFSNGSGSGSLQRVGGDLECGELKMRHVSVLVQGWTWIPDNLDNLYSCRRGLSCLWTKYAVLADKPDALMFETTMPPFQHRKITWIPKAAKLVNCSIITEEYISASLVN